MKALAALLVFGALGWLALDYRARADRAEALAKAIAEQRVILMMTQQQVHQSLGDPITTSVDKTGRESWIYPEQRVDFSRGKVIETVPASAGHRWSYVPELGRYVEHPANVSPKTGAGINAASSSRIHRPTGPTAEIRKDWGWKGHGTALDKKPQR